VAAESKVVRRLAVGAASAVLCAVTVISAPPLCNWDMIGYAAAAYESAGLRGDGLHRQAYEDVRRVCPEAYASLTGANPYRIAVATDPAALAAQLPFYRVKVLYGAALGRVARSGRSPAAATIWLSRVAYVATAVLTALWLARALGPVLAAVLAWVFLSIPGIFDVGRLGTPDALSVFVLLSSAFLASAAGRPRWALALAVAAVWVRPDNILWLLTLGAYLGARQRDLRAPAVGGLAVAALSYLVIHQLSGSYGWAGQIQQQFVMRTPDPGAAGASIGVAEYALVLLKASHPAHLPPLLLPVLLVGAGTVYLRRRLALESPDQPKALVPALVFIALHWLAYPAEDRFLVAGYLMVLISATLAGARIRSGPKTATGRTLTPAEAPL
jgi:hypothetical protein